MNMKKQARRRRALARFRNEPKDSAKREVWKAELAALKRYIDFAGRVKK